MYHGHYGNDNYCMIVSNLTFVTHNFRKRNCKLNNSILLTKLQKLTQTSLKLHEFAFAGFVRYEYTNVPNAFHYKSNSY